MPRVNIRFTPEKDLTNNVVLYTVVGYPVEGPIPTVFPERSFTTIEDLEIAMSPTISPDLLEIVRKNLGRGTQFILEVDAEQALAIGLLADLG
jgi:hypothetical protein